MAAPTISKRKLRSIMLCRGGHRPPAFCLCGDKRENWAFSLPPPFGHLPHQREASTSEVFLSPRHCPKGKGRLRPASPQKLPLRILPYTNVGVAARFLPLWEQKEKLGVFSPSALRAPPSSEGGKHIGSVLKPTTLPQRERQAAPRPL